MAGKFPQVIYVRWETADGDSPLMIAENDFKDHAEIGKKVRVGAYRLIEEVWVEAQVDIEPVDGVPSDGV